MDHRVCLLICGALLLSGALAIPVENEAQDDSVIKIFTDTENVQASQNNEVQAQETVEETADTEDTEDALQTESGYGRRRRATKAPTTWGNRRRRATKAPQTTWGKIGKKITKVTKSTTKTT